MASNNETSVNGLHNQKWLPDITSASTNTTRKVLAKSDESHIVEDRALERLGRLLSASASIFTSREDPSASTQAETNKDVEQDSTFSNNNDDLMSTSDTSSHLWQEISGKDGTNT